LSALVGIIKSICAFNGGKMDNPIENSHSSRFEWIIAFIPVIIVIFWLFIFTLFIAGERNYDITFVITIIPVSVVTLIILLTRIIYPIKQGCFSLIRTVIPSILIYPVACLFFIVRSQTGPNGAGVMIYYFSVASFCLTLCVGFATLIGSNLKRWLGKSAS